MKHFAIILFLTAAMQVTAQSWLPKTEGCDCQMVRHVGYTLCYDEGHEQAQWVAYVLTRERVGGPISRKGNDRFVADTTVKTGSAVPWNYGGKEYDRGHLAPAADMKWSVRAMRESFLMSNMSPQEHGFNEGLWHRAEEQVRRWAVEYDSLLVVTGPVLQEGLPQVEDGEGNCISVPLYYYKVVYDPVRKTGIGLLIEHQNSRKPIASFAVTIDEVEKATGLDFFPGIADEEKMERTICLPCWGW